MEEAVSTDQKHALIKSQPCFKVLTDNEISELSELFIDKPFKAGEVVVTEGEIVDSVYLIVSGTAEVQHAWVDNGKIKIDKLADLGPGQAIGLSASGLFSLSGLRTATVIAKTDMQLLRMNVTLFNGFVLSHSNVSKALHAAASIDDEF